MSSEEVLELSVEETNKLRLQLGLKPLRIDKKVVEPSNDASPSSPTREAGRDGKEEVLEMSIDETNDLRVKLGLAPLRVGENSKKAIIHKPAENEGDQQEAAARVEKLKLRRDVEKGASKIFGSKTLADQEEESTNEEGENGALSWAAKMRRSKSKPIAGTKQQSSKATTTAESYDQKDLEGINVAHNLSEIETGSTTILTLADSSILQTKDSTSKKPIGINKEGETLENVNLAEQKKQQDGLKKKRQLEMGMGRAGGYAGFDDDEFEELGGARAPSRLQRGNQFFNDGDDDEDDTKRSRGFRIGEQATDGGKESMNDFDAMQQGFAISLEPAKPDAAASDYMTIEEEELERMKRKKKKDGTFKKKKKEKKKSKKEKKRRRKLDDSDVEDEDEPSGQNNNATSASLLEQLEETAVGDDEGDLPRRRRTETSNGESKPDHVASQKDDQTNMEDENERNEARKKRAKYDVIMAKGNERTRKAFQEVRKEPMEEVDLKEEADDSFLNAALAKARRLNRLRDLKEKKASRGADAVAEAVRSTTKNEADDGKASASDTKTFTIDDTREFTRAIRARAQQTAREQQRAKLSVPSNPKVEDSEPSEDVVAAPAATTPKVEEVQHEEEAEDMDIEELAKEVKTDDLQNRFDGSTADSVGVGRGLSAFVSMLRHTGEISGKNAGREELRGRAKDERNYDYYKPLDLKKVVKIGNNATDKDKEFASREVKLEYRDKHGRLLTQKEAFRELCYQFHGYGASKKNEEKRLKQIAREQAEARLASRQVAAARDGTSSGTLGALKATQKATGKAFIVHKT